jgi:hypothetical protein
MENTLRNEVSITLAGEERIMRATFTAIVAIEKALGKSMTAIINQVAAGDISITDSALIVYHGLRGNQDTRMSFEQVGEALVEAGMAAVSLPVVEFVSRSLSGVSVGKPEETEAQ